VTSQKDQIQALIADIDGVLQKTTPRLPWVMSGEAAQQRQVLERVRNFLVSLQRRMAVEGFGAPIARTDLLAPDAYYSSGQNIQPGEATGGSPSEISAHQMLQVVMQDMGYLRASLMQPLQADVENLQQQREHLIQEIRHLESQRQSSLLSQSQVVPQQWTAEFTQAVMGQLQAAMTQQLTQAGGGQVLPSSVSPALLGTTSPGTAIPYQSVEQLRAFQSRMDEVVMGLDATLNVVFQSLQRNVNTYQDSLERGVDKLHHLGQQGEMIFTALINHLAQKLGQEVSAYLPSAPVTTQLQPAAQSEPAPVSPASMAGETVISDYPSRAETHASVETPHPLSQSSFPDMAFPYAGAEIPPPPGNVQESPVASLDQAIDSWLSAAAMTEVAPATDSNLEDLTAADLEIAELDLSDLELNQLSQEEIDAILNLEASTTTDFIQLGSFYPTTPSPAAPLPQTPLERADLIPDFIAEPAFTEDSADVETIGSLTDLFGDEGTTKPPQSDSYPSASPEEVLLPEAAIAMPDLVLDEATLSRLSQDLSSLELGESLTSPAQPEQQEVDVSNWTLEDWMQEAAKPSTPEQPALEDWNDTTLDDFAAALPETEPVQTPIEELSPIPGTDANTFTLEGMDNLFADFPAAPASPSPAADTTSAIAQSADLEQPDLLSLEEMQNLFGEELEPPVASVSPTDQPAPAEPTGEFTLEGMEDLFGEAAPTEPTSVSVADTPVPFTLEGMEDLFGEAAPAEPTSVSAADTSVSFTLEGMEDLFGDASATTPPPAVNQPDSSTPTTPLADEPLPFTLEGIEDLFADLPGMESTPGGAQAAIAQPVHSADEQPHPQNSSAQFRLEQVDDLFMEVLPDESQISAPPTDAT
jgi:hypothetical protein